LLRFRRKSQKNGSRYCRAAEVVGPYIG